MQRLQITFVIETETNFDGGHPMTQTRLEQLQMELGRAFLQHCSRGIDWNLISIPAQQLSDGFVLSFTEGVPECDLHTTDSLNNHTLIAELAPRPAAHFDN